MYGPVIYARCRGLLGDGAAAEDATQETFLRVQRHLARLPPGDQALFWIYRVATNLCLNEIRDRRARPLVAADLGNEARTAEARNPERMEERMIDGQLCQQIIDGAPAELRAVAWLAHVDGYEQEAIADILGISLRTVAGRLARFRQRAQKFVNKS